MGRTGPEGARTSVVAFALPGLLARSRDSQRPSESGVHEAGRWGGTSRKMTVGLDEVVTSILPVVWVCQCQEALTLLGVRTWE